MDLWKDLKSLCADDDSSGDQAAAMGTVNVNSKEGLAGMKDTADTGNVHQGKKITLQPPLPQRTSHQATDADLGYQDASSPEEVVPASTTTRTRGKKAGA